MGETTITKAQFAKRTILEVSSFITTIIVLIVDALLGYFTYRLIILGYIPLAVVFILIIAIISFSFLIPKAHMFRWMAVGLAAWLLFSIFPILYTIYNAFTNYGDAHLITQTQAINQIESQTYLPETGKAYKWVAFRSPENAYLLWLKDTEGHTSIVRMVDANAEDHTLEVIPGQNGIGELDEDGVPKTIEGYVRLNRITAATDKNLTTIEFGDPEKTIRFAALPKRLNFALFVYDGNNTFTNQQTGVVYTDIEGTYTAKNGAKLIPGYSAVVGTKNFVQFVTAPGLRGPLATIVSWNFIFAFMSLFLTFSVGLLISIIYGDPKFKGKKLLRSLLLIPYTIPSLITILIWRGMLNPHLGIINRVPNSLFGLSPDWHNVVAGAHAILIVTPGWATLTGCWLPAALCSPSPAIFTKPSGRRHGWQRFWNITPLRWFLWVGDDSLVHFQLQQFQSDLRVYQRWTAYPERDDPSRLHGHYHQLRIQSGVRQRSRRPVWICFGNLAGTLCFDCHHVFGAIQVHEYVGGGWRKCLIRRALPINPNPSNAANVSGWSCAGCWRLSWSHSVFSRCSGSFPRRLTR